MVNTSDSLQAETNKTFVKRSFIPYGITTGIVVNAVLMLLVVGGNFLVIAAYARNRRLRSGKYVFLVSLAFSDLLVGVVAIPIRIYGSATSWNLSASVITFYIAFDIFSAVASNLHLMAISFERFMAASRPFYYQTLSVRPYAIGSVVSWGLAVVVAALRPGNYSQEGVRALLNVYLITLFVVCFLGPLTVITFVNIGVFRVAKSLIQRIPLHHESDRQRLRKERKTALTLLLMTSFFFIAWFPFFVVNMLYLICAKCLPSSMEAQFLLVDIIKWLHYSNSAVNPVIYAFRDIEMRKTFAYLLGLVGRFCGVNQVEPELHPNQTGICMDMLTRK